DNKLMVFDTTPTGLLNILNYAAGLSSGASQQSGGYPQVGNIRFSYDSSRSAGQKVRTVSLVNEAGQVVSGVVENGSVLSSAPSLITVVTLNFTANGGDSYPIKYLNPPTNTTVNSETSNFRYVLANGNLSASVTRSLDFTASSTFTSLGLTTSDILGEQKAFQDFMAARYGSTSTAYNQADTSVAQDLRIQQLARNGNSDTVNSANGGATFTPPTFAFGSASSTVLESAGTAVLTIIRSGDLSAASVNVSTADGTASAGTDYTALSNFAVPFASGETTKTVAVTIANRSGAQGSRTFTASLSGGLSVVIASPSTTTVTIDDTTASITPTIAGDTGGSVSGGGSYALGQSATFTATPATGFRFLGWKVNGSSAGTTNPLVTTVTAGMSVEASFGYQVQILHFYGESGLLGTTTAPIMGAMIDRFDDQYVNTVVLAEGDTFIPGPWLIAGADPSFNRLLHTGTFTSAAATTATPMGQADIAIMNAFGTTASALGNHEFDLGSPVLSGAFFPANSSTVGNWAGAQFPFITTNLDFSADSSLKGRADNSLGGTGGAIAGSDVSALKGKIAPYAIKTINGQKIGFVGATTWELQSKSSPNGTIPKDDANNSTSDLQEVAAYLQGAVNALQALGVNKIIQVDQLDALQRNKD
ncbi:MAG: 2',3'-cyclic-nucleotide 2'-phosphodiesterase/5'- or 3'-nucleotidase, 5'-nucleotidase family, partial [Verrucomicrobia bacterium]